MAIRADNTWGHVVSTLYKSRLIRPYTVLVRLRVQIPILWWLRQLLISVLDSDLWSSSRFHDFNVSDIFMSELGRLHPYAIVLAVRNWVLFLGNEGVEFAVSAMVSWATDWELARILLAWGVKSLNTGDCHRLCVRTSGGSLWSGLIVIGFRDLLSVNLERTRDVDWYRLLSSRFFLKKAEFGSSFSQLNCIFLAGMLCLF